MYIGEIIKKYREEHHLSQRAFASLTSLSPSYINTLEKIYNPKTNKPYSVTTDVAVEIANAMNTTVENLLNMLDKSQEFQINTVPLVNIQQTEIPVLGTVKAGYDYLTNENIIGHVFLRSEEHTSELQSLPR